MLKTINKTIAIAGLARDCARQIENHIPKIEKLRTYFNDLLVIVIENDSIDNTKEILTKWAKNYRDIKIISNNFGTVTVPKKTGKEMPESSIYRINKMSEYRNVYLDYLKNIDRQIDYLMIIDFDVEYFSVKGIIKTIETAPVDWGGIFANGRPFYKLLGFTLYGFQYDTYAYLQSRNTLPFRKEHLLNNTHIMEKALKKVVFHRCESAFGGIAIYKMAAVENLRYYVIKNNDEYITSLSEHLSINLKITDQNRYSNYISKKIIVKRHLNFGAVLPRYIPQWIFEIIYSILNRIKNKYTLV